MPPAHDNLSPAPEQLAALLEPPHTEDHAAQVRRVVEYSPPGHDAARVQGDLEERKCRQYFSTDGRIQRCHAEMDLVKICKLRDKMSKIKILAVPWT